MAKKAFVINGFGYGDECKGKTTLWLCAKYGAHTVVRTGASQALHRVVTSSGQKHVHAQFGSGTLVGAATHLSKNMVIDPYAIISEGNVLQKELGVRDVFKKLTIHEDTLVITPFQAIANRLRELSRGNARHGSVGIGVGETVLDAEVLGEVAIRAKDLAQPHLLDKLDIIRIHKTRELRELIENVKNLPLEIQGRANFEVANLKNFSTMKWAIGWFNKLTSIAKIVNTDYVADNILGQDGTIVFEGSQGVLLDRWYGFHPYTTKVRTIPEAALSIIKDCNYNGEVKSLGVLRAYHTRHGAGPFVAECPELTRQLPDENNKNHPWQGNFRVGCFDVVAAKYAIEVCAGTLDRLIITCVDRIAQLGEWKICRSYDGPHDTRLFSRNDMGKICDITVSHSFGNSQLKQQEKLGQLLSQCSPNVEIFDVPSRKLEYAVSLCAGVLGRELNIPIVSVSVGPTEKDCIEL